MQSDVECSGGDGEIDGSLQPGVGKLTNSQSREIKLNLVGEIKQPGVGEIYQTEVGKSMFEFRRPIFPQ